MTDTLESLQAEWERIIAALKAERDLLLATAQDRKRLGEEGVQLRKLLEAAERERDGLILMVQQERGVREAQVAKLREALEGLLTWSPKYVEESDKGQQARQVLKETET